MADGILEGGQAIASAITQIVEQQRQAKMRFAHTIIEKGVSDPEILQDKNAQKALAEYVGKENVPGLTALLTAKQDPSAVLQQVLGIPKSQTETAAKTQAAQQLGIGEQPGPTTEAQQQQVAAAAPGQTFPVLAAEAQRRGFGVSVSPSGTTVTRAAPSAKDIGESASIASWMNISQSLQGSGLPQGQADQLAARYTMGEMAKLGMVPPPDLRRIATASTENEIAAAREGLTSRERIKAETEGAAGLASERERGQVLGAGRGAAEAAFDTVKVLGPDGQPKEINTAQAPAYAATGSELARSLGKNPPKEQLEAAALQGNDIFTAPNGDIISLPIGSAPKLRTIPAQALLQGNEAINALDQVRGVIDDIKGNPDFRNSFPSEKEIGRAGARALGWAKSWARGLTDAAGVMTQRGQLRQLGFRLARLFGSNSQLSDAERENAQKVIQPLIDGSATQEVYDSAIDAMTKYLDGADKRRKEGRAPQQGRDEFLDNTGKAVLDEYKEKPAGAEAKTEPKPRTGKPLRGADAQRAVGGTQQKLAEALAEEVNAGRMTAEQAAKRLARGRAAGLVEE